MAPRGALQHSYAYLRYRDFAEAGDYWLAASRQGGEFVAGAPFFRTTAGTQAFSDPWQLLTSAQFRRAPADESRHGGPSAVAGIARMRRQMTSDFGDSARVTGAFDGDKLVACGIDLLDEHNYYGLTYGCDYSHPNLSTCYMCIAYYDPIRFCLARGIGTLRYGFEAFEPKVLRGASLTPLEFWIWTPDEKVNHALADLLAFIEAGQGRT